MGWFVAAAVVILLAIIPLGVSASYGAPGASVKITAGPFRFSLYPNRKPADKKNKAEKKNINRDSTPQATQNTTHKADSKQPSQPGGSWKDFLPLAKVAMDFLNQFRKKMRVNDLELNVILAGDDPCDLGLNYGRTWIAVSELIALADRTFVIKRRNIQVLSDFTADKTLVTAYLKLTISFGRLLSLAAAAGVKGLREFLTIRKKRKAVS